ncbi:hypothetical protein DMT42_11085 [Streptomyces actuosus]|uniref:DUF2742 domain-containing protein n=2 Tax=Streptomyces TaxID=1883 RepID=A0A2U9P012_STRAS|nr:hypothetical protein DMT42_11085 [Streptomyces actuosus]
MNAETPRGQSGAFHEDSAAGGKSAATVAHARPETEPEAVIADYWQAAKARYRRGDYPDYGSDDWKALPLHDPRKMAGLVAFAQMWLRYGDEIADDLNRQLRTPRELVHRATTEACAKAWTGLLAQQERRRKEAA